MGVTIMSAQEREHPDIETIPTCKTSMHTTYDWPEEEALGNEKICECIDGLLTIRSGFWRLSDPVRIARLTIALVHHLASTLPDAINIATPVLVDQRAYSLWDELHILANDKGMLVTTNNHPDHEECLMVSRSESGTYDYMGDATIESWPEVAAEAEAIEHLDNLRGWSTWTDAYRVTINGCKVYYFAR